MHKIVTYAHVGAKVAGQVAVDVTSVEDLALSSFVSIEARLLEGATVNVGLGNLGDDGKVLARLSIGVNLLDLVRSQRSFSSQFVQGIPDLGVLITITSTGHSHQSRQDDQALHGCGRLVEEDCFEVAEEKTLKLR